MIQKKTRFITISIIVVVAFIYLIVWGNTALELNTYTISSSMLPNAFDGYRIAHVSDLHNCKMGEDNENLINMLKEAKPDIIAITGDLIDSRHTDIEIALEFAKEALKIAPCYYVSGNHEARVSEYVNLIDGLTHLGVIVLEDKRIDLRYNDDLITLVGIADPSFKTDYLFGDTETVVRTQLQNNINMNDSFTILLSHRPELFEIYSNFDINLVLSGHAHGGQFRLPFVGGVVAPNQGLFPEYVEGLYTKGNTNMIVSRGIGNSIIPFRFNNRPEVILIQLESNSF